MAVFASFAAFVVWVFLPGLNSFFDPQEFVTFLNAVKVDTPFVQYIRGAWSWQSNDASLIGFFRPMASTAYLVEFQFFGGDPLGYKISNLVLHLVSAFVIGWTVASLSRNKLAGFAAGMIFSVHPATVRATSWICARPDILATVFSVLAFRFTVLLKDRKRFTRLSLLPALFTALALSGKELGIANFLALPIAYFMWPGRSGNRKNTVFFAESMFLVTVLYFFARFLIFGGLGGYGSYAPLTQLHQRVFAVFLQATEAYYVPLQAGRIAVYLLVAAALTGIAVRLNNRVRYFATALLVTGVYSFQTLIGSVEAHYAYAPTAFTIVFLSVLCSHLNTRRRIFRGAAAAVLILLLLVSGVTARRESLTYAAQNIEFENVYRGLESILVQLENHEEVEYLIYVSDSCLEGDEMKNVPLYMQFLAPGKYSFLITLDLSTRGSSPAIVWDGRSFVVIR
jgi:hypothetical protein